MKPLVARRWRTNMDAYIPHMYEREKFTEIRVREVYILVEHIILVHIALPALQWSIDVHGNLE